MYRPCEKCGFKVQEHTSDWTRESCPRCGAYLALPAKNSTNDNIIVAIVVGVILVVALGMLSDCSQSNRYDEEIPYEEYYDSYVVPQG